MTDLRPFNVKNHRMVHVTLASATTASTSFTALATGVVRTPVYFWVLSSGVASVAVLNGSAGSVFFAAKTTAGVMVQAPFWDDTFIGNKALVLESSLAGGGTIDFHVWYTVRRVGAGESGTTL